LITYFDADYDIYNEYSSIIVVSLLSYFSIFFSRIFALFSIQD